MHMPFQSGNNRNFCLVPRYESQPYAIIGAPVDCATTFRSGARHGPNAIRDASMMLTDGVCEAYPVDITRHTGDAGDMPLPSGYTERMVETVKESVLGLGGSHVIMLGGDHSVTYGALAAHRSRPGSAPLPLVHFDAHCDTWQDHFGTPFGHGNWLRRAVDEGLVDASRTISIGVRSPADTASRNFLVAKGGTTLSARSAMRHSPKMMSDVILSKVGGSPCYLSIDIDCLDPAHAPGTGTPEIGGLTTIWLLEVLENLGRVNWMGMDCVEVAPAYDHSQITALAAATIVWQYLSMNIHKAR